MAGVKVTALAEATSISTDDLIMIIDDPAGSEANKKATFTNVVASIPEATTEAKGLMSATDKTAHDTVIANFDIAGDGKLITDGIQDEAVTDAKIATIETPTKLLKGAYDQFVLKYDLTSIIAYYGGTPTANGAVSKTAGLYIPVGQTGGGAFRTAAIQFASAANTFDDYLIGKTWRWYIYLTVANLDQIASLAYGLESKTVTNKREYWENETTYVLSFDYTYSTQATLNPFFQIVNSTAVSAQVHIDFVKIAMNVVDNNYVSNNSQFDTISAAISAAVAPVNTKIVALDSTGNGLLDVGKIENNGVLDANIYRVTTPSKILYGAKDQFIMKYDLTGNVSTYTGSPTLNGAISTPTGLTVPSGQTGASAYRTANLPFASANLTIGSTLIDKTWRFYIYFNITDGFFTEVDSIIYGLLGKTVTNKKEYYESSTVYVVSFDYVFTAEETLSPYFQITNTSAAASDVTIEFAAIKFAIVDAVYQNDQQQMSLIGAMISDQSSGRDTDQDSLLTLIRSNKDLDWMPIDNLITVDASGGGDFTTITAALASITDNSETNWYLIYVYPGVYEEQNINATPKSFITIMGAYRDSVIIQGYLAGSTAEATIIATSTVDWRCTGNLVNLTITRQNGRYAVHPETGVAYDLTIRARFQNCRFIHYGNAEADAHYGHTVFAPSVVGAGLQTNGWLKIIGCEFICYGTGAGMYIHNSPNEEYGSRFELDGCILSATTSLNIDNIGSTKTNIFKITNNTMAGRVRIGETSFPHTGGDTYYRHKDIDIIAYGNTGVYLLNFGFNNRVARLTSTDVTGASSVRLSGDYEDIFGEYIYKDGDGGVPGIAYGTKDISMDVAYASDTSHYLNARLGDRTSSPMVFDVISGGTTDTVTLDQNYTGYTFNQIRDAINAQLTNSVFEGWYIDNDEYLFKDTGMLRPMTCTDTVGILDGMAVAYDDIGGIRRMTTSDDINDFVGVAMENINPNERGLILLKGNLVSILYDPQNNRSVKQYSFEACANGTNYGINTSNPGYFTKDATPTILRGIGDNVGRLLE